MKAEKASKIARVILSVIFCIVIYIFGAALVNGLFNSNSITGIDPNNNTDRNAAIAGCESEGKKTNNGVYTDAQLTNYCKCAITKIEEKYPALWSNKDLLTDKVKNGFSEDDMRYISSCFPTT